MAQAPHNTGPAAKFVGTPVEDAPNKGMYYGRYPWGDKIKVRYDCWGPSAGSSRDTAEEVAARRLAKGAGPMRPKALKHRQRREARGAKEEEQRRATLAKVLYAMDPGGCR